MIGSHCVVDDITCKHIDAGSCQQSGVCLDGTKYEPMEVKKREEDPEQELRK